MSREKWVEKLRKAHEAHLDWHERMHEARGHGGHHARFRGPPWDRHGRFPRSPLTPLARYMRARLHRRLFALLGFAIVFAVTISWAVLTMASDTGPWGDARTRVRHFAETQFAAAWDDPARRDALADSIAKDLKFPVELLDRDRRVLGSFGGTCDDTAVTAPLKSPAGTEGFVRVCWPVRHPSPWAPVLPLAIVALGLWGLSGAFSRRLARPLGELSRVAQEIGEGNLQARAELHCNGFDEVAMVAGSVNDMAARIEKQLADQRELLAAVSHELRTPLARMRLLVELMRDGTGDAARLDDLEREVLEIDALVGELLANARLDFAAPARRPLDAKDQATRALERAGLGTTLLSVEPPDDAVPLEADPTLLARAFANLIDNAKKHGGGLLALRVKQDAVTVAIEAEDGGPGFPAGSEDRVFQPFRPRADGQDRPAGSLGLGLALVKRIAEAHGGKAYARNRDGGGAVVGLRIPRKAPEKPARGETA